jgi:hypothetical protein
MTKILERISGYSDEMMAERCDRLISVMTKTVQIKKGKGDDASIIEVRKYKDDEGILKMLYDSKEFYTGQKMDTSFKFRDYQVDIIKTATDIISKRGFVYLAMQVRTGKTLTSMGIAQKLKSSNVLFITKKKAISSIEADYKTLSPDFYIRVINYESLHLVCNEKKWDLIVLDEAHSVGAFPKANQRALAVKDIIARNRPKVILLSGTPTPESYAQMYHQVYAIPGNPFAEFSNFYRFCDKHVKVKEKKINGFFIKDYSDGKQSILDEMRPYTINYTQSEAGFVSEITEEVLEVKMNPSTYKLINQLKRDLVVQGKDEVILGDTPVKLMTKIHQLCSGTIKFESGNSMVLDLSKAEFIKEHFAGTKIGIFYKFKEELNAIEQVFGDEITTSIEEFDTTDKNIALQIVSGREGISLRNADYLVYYNIDFSATSYWQSRDRMTTKDRPNNNVYWVFSKGGIEKEIYKTVTKKKDFTVNHFKKLLL